MMDFPEEYYREYDALEQLWLPDGSILLRDRLPSYSIKFQRLDYWLLFPNGTPVAYLNCLYFPGEERYKLTLGNIEVRAEYRRSGLARELICAVEALHGETLYSTGGFTQDGFKHLADRTPLVEGAMAEILFNAMTFVADWSLLVSKT